VCNVVKFLELLLVKANYEQSAINPGGYKNVAEFIENSGEFQEKVAL
jgi:hypothetical protein